MPNPSRHYFKELRLQQFRSLVALARWQTFTAAASALKLTRASVWQQVRGLEKELECNLLRNRGQRVEFTTAGEKLVQIVTPLVAGFDSVKTEFLAAIRDDLPQTLVIATPPSFLVHELSGPIARIHALYPRLQLTFLERNSATALDLLERGEADVALAARLPTTRHRPALEYTPFTRYPFTFICPVDHALVTKKRLTLKDIAAHPLILPGPNTYCRQHFDEVMAAAGLSDRVKVVIESGFPVMLYEYVKMGMGVALTPLPGESAGSPHHRGAVLRTVEHLFGDEEICLVRRRGEFETPPATTLRELVTTERSRHI